MRTRTLEPDPLPLSVDVITPKSGMNLKKNSPCLRKINEFLSIFVKLCSLLIFVASPYFGHDAFMAPSFVILYSRQLEVEVYTMNHIYLVVCFNIR